MEKQELADYVKGTLRAIEQVMAGEELRAHRPLGLGAIIGGLVAGFIILSILFALVVTLVDMIAF